MSDAPDHTIVFENVSLLRGTHRVFHDLSVTLNEQRIGLIGANGSGKSSMLRLINGLLLPDQGSVRVNELETKADRKQLPAQVGFVFQNPDHHILFPTVSEELAFGLIEQGMSQVEAARRVQAYLEDNNCSDWGSRAIYDLSEGQKQRVCLMSVMITHPRILLLDEPFSSLDLRQSHAFSKRLMQLSQMVIMACHQFEFLETFERVIWLDEGKIAADGKPTDVIAAYRAFAARGV